MMAVCQTYAEGRPADLSVHEGREAQKWLTGAHRVVERAREHISMRLRHLAGAREIGAPLQTPRRVYSYQQQEKRRAKLMAYSRTRRAGSKPWKQVEEAVARARLQAAKAIGTPERSQLAEGVDTTSEETGGGQQRDSTGPRTPGGTEVDLVDSTSESDTSDPGGMPQLFRGAEGLSACPSKLLRMPPHEPGNEEAAWDVGEPPAAESRKESPGHGQSQEVGTGSSLTEMGDDGAQAPAPNRPSGGNDEFARELASAMSNIASLVIKASGHSVSNGGWLYFDGESEDYCTFRSKCRLFQGLTTRRPRRWRW
jgi:hypothetical protein